MKRKMQIMWIQYSVNFKNVIYKLISQRFWIKINISNLELLEVVISIFYTLVFKQLRSIASKYENSLNKQLSLIACWDLDYFLMRIDWVYRLYSTGICQTIYGHFGKISFKHLDRWHLFWCYVIAIFIHTNCVNFCRHCHCCKIAVKVVVVIVMTLD